MPLADFLSPFSPMWSVPTGITGRQPKYGHLQVSFSPFRFSCLRGLDLAGFLTVPGKTLSCLPLLL